MFCLGIRLGAYFRSSRLLTRSVWSISTSNQTQTVTLECTSTGEILKFPSVWLRDNCQCSTCFDKTLESRLIPLKQFTARILPISMTYSKDHEGVSFNVKWPDKHESTFTLDWLKEHNFNLHAQNKRLLNKYKFEKRTWNSSSFKKVIRYYNFDELMSSDLQLLKWLVTLNQIGIAIITDAGTDQTQVEKLTTRIGFLKKTTYGNLYRVEAKKDATNAAYLSTPLELHIDLPYYEYCPSFNILHFAIQSKAEHEGENQLTDGFELCKQIKNYDSKMYATLADSIIEWTDYGKDGELEFSHIHRAPVICENAAGIVTRVNFSQHQRGTDLCMPIEQVNAWYEAMRWFIHLAHHPRNLVRLKMKEGDLLTFDNLRILHGRSAFTGDRCVIGGYLDADIVNSKIRILVNKLKTSIQEL